MANSLVEGPIMIPGAGFVAKETGNFQPGEYKRLNNIEIDRDGVLTNRRNVTHVGPEVPGNVLAPYVDPQRFLGSMGEYTLVATKTGQYALGSNTRITLWNNLAAGPTGGQNGSRFAGYFRYNQRNHWIVIEYSAVSGVSVALYHDPAATTGLPGTCGPGYEASLTRVVVLNFPIGSVEQTNFQLKNFFIYKERLWLATTGGLYFSGPTDLVNFTVPTGGFFKHPGDNIMWALGIKDIIYTFCEDSIYALTYNVDPNLDSVERPISTDVGGEMACIHLDTPYFINNLGIFAINGNNISKVMDSRFDYGGDIYRNRIYSFENYLIVLKYSVQGVYTQTLNNFSRGSCFEPFQNGNSLGYNAFFINTETGATHVLDFTDQYTAFSYGNAGFIVDAITNPYKDDSGNYKWVFLTNKRISEVGDGSFNGYCYYISSAEAVDINDYVFNTAGVLERRAPKIYIELDSYVPDGLEYRVKKFRSLLIQGVFPTLAKGMQIQVGYDNENFGTAISVGNDESGLDSPRRHFAHRIGLNQRARSVTLAIFNSLWASTISEPYGKLEISDMRVMWTPTQRLPVTKDIGS